MASRAYCRICDYPAKTCVCSGIDPVRSHTRITVLQDPSETTHAKNTAKLLPLLVEHALIVVGQTPEEFNSVRERIQNTRHSLVLYPHSSAQPLDSFRAATPPVDHLILLDGTWRKAKKLWLNNPWLHSLDSGIIAHGTTQYAIRKAPFEGSHSTLEAAAQALHVCEGIPLEPFIKALNTLQDSWFHFAPSGDA